MQRFLEQRTSDGFLQRKKSDKDFTEPCREMLIRNSRIIFQFVVDMQREVLALYIGMMLGIIGNFFVSTIIEMAKAEFEPKSPTNLLWFWSVMFISSSIITFQLMKWAMKKFDLSKRELRSFDYATFILTLVGIFVLVWDRILR